MKKHTSNGINLILRMDKRFFFALRGPLRIINLRVSITVLAKIIDAYAVELNLSARRSFTLKGNALMLAIARI